MQEIVFIIQLLKITVSSLPQSMLKFDAYITYY